MSNEYILISDRLVYYFHFIHLQKKKKKYKLHARSNMYILHAGNHCYMVAETFSVDLKCLTQSLTNTVPTTLGCD